ncbi:hypothetical protein D3C77_716990 [compost metagenome]
MRINAPGHLIENHKSMPAPQCTRGTASTWARRSGVGVLGRVGTGGDGLLEFFHVAQLGLAGGQRLRCVDMRRVVGQ